MESGKSTLTKILGFTGFLIGFITMIIGISIYFVAVGTAITTGGGMAIALWWTILCVLGLALSILAIIKSKASGAKAGIAVYGLVLGILSVCLSLFMIYSVHIEHVENPVNLMFDSLSSSLKDSVH